MGLASSQDSPAGKSCAPAAGAGQPFPPSLINMDIDHLVDSIVRDSAVVFVGAGASLAAGLPLWKEFLQASIARAKKSYGGTGAWSAIDSRFHDGDFLIAAELLQKQLGSVLEGYFCDTFAPSRPPSPIHHAIASIPFSLAITTNYDGLLEAAYRETPPVLTWRDPDAILSAIKYGRKAIVKTHGDVNKPGTLVLTKTQYRDLLHLNAAFNACLRHLLAQRTFLFVGHSLRDHDILSLMDEARLLFDKGFGPHYAILFENEADEQMIAYLRDSYAIRVILCRPGAAPSGAEMTRVVARVLREIGGRVAERLHARSPGVRVDDALFSQRRACEQLLDEAIRLTGSFRGEVCLQCRKSPSGEEVRAIEVFSLMPPEHDAACCPPLRSKDCPHVGQKIDHSSVIGRLYLQRHDVRSEDFVYISNVCTADDELKKQGFIGAAYRPCHPEVRSELAVPIFSDGQRVGALNVESKEPESYTAVHKDVLRKLADQIGWVCFAARQRDEFANPLARFFSVDGFKEFTGLLNISRYLSGLDIRLILWRIDAIHGRMRAFFDRDKLPASSDPKVEFNYRFEDDSLATHVLRTRQKETIPDVEEALRHDSHQSLNKKGCDHFGIRGPITAIPIRAAGHTAAVLVAWSNLGREATERFKHVPERLRRLAHLIANDPYLVDEKGHHESLAKRFLREFDQVMEPIDEGKPWFPKRVGDPVFRVRAINALMLLLLHECVGLGRIRLWAWNPQTSGFRCIRSITLPSHTTPGKNPENAYVGVEGNPTDTYVSYTVSRFAGDPYARVQHHTMFNGHDSNDKALDKDPNGSWLVAPIVDPNPEVRRLLGYLSADSHLYDSAHGAPREAPVDSRTSRFQRYAMDVVSSLLAYLLRFEKRSVILPTAKTKPPARPARPASRRAK